MDNGEADDHSDNALAVINPLLSNGLATGDPKTETYFTVAEDAENLSGKKHISNPDDVVEVLGDSEFAVVDKHGLPVDSPEKPEEPKNIVSHLEKGILPCGPINNGSGDVPNHITGTEAEYQKPKTGLQGLSETSKHILGLVLIALHCLTIVGSGQFAKATYTKDFSAPFFIVYFRSVWRISVFPAFMVTKWLLRLSRNKSGKPVSFSKTFTTCQSVFGPQGLTIRSFVYPTGVLASLWIVVQFMHVFAVKFLNNSIVQALFCSETAFSYLLSALILKAPVFVIKVIGVVIALGGVGFMVYSQGQDDLRWEGIAICISGAVLGSIYMVAFKKFIGKSEDVGKALLLTSTMAVFITVIGWPLIMIFYYTGVEYWTWEKFPWGIICASSSLTLVSISLFNLCLTLTSPLLMTLSKLLGIPTNYVVDWIFWNHQFDIFQIVGCVFIGVGFIAIALPERWITLKKWAALFRNSPEPASVSQNSLKSPVAESQL